MDPFDLQRITSALAAASVDPSRWNNALEAVVTSTNSYGALLLPVIGDLPFLSLTPSMGDAFEIYVKDGWHTRDERYRGTPHLLKHGVTIDDDCMSDDERRKSPFYQNFLAANKLKGYVGVRVGRDDCVWNLSLQRSSREGDFSKREISWLARLASSLDSVSKVASALATVRGEAALDAFQFSNHPAILFNRKCEVVRANAAAEDLLGEDLIISQGRVRSWHPHGSELLNRSIRSLLWNETASVLPPLAIRKKSGGKLVLYLMRLPGLSDSPLSAFHVIAVISDTDAARSYSLTTLRTAFDLTLAESRLAIAIGNGQDPDSFARDAHVSKETVRTQLKAVFAKTGTKRQAELAAMLATLIPRQ